MEKVHFIVNKNSTLVGILHSPSTKSQVGVLILHGMQASKDQLWMKELGERLSRKGIVALRFDFLGNGESDGNTSNATYEQGLRDIRSAISFLKTKNISKIILVGHSMGGGIALLVANREKVSGVCALAPIVNPNGISNRIVRRQGKKVFVRFDIGLVELSQAFVSSAMQYTAKDLGANLHCPVCIIHGTKDELLSYKDSKAFLERVPAKDKKFVAIENADHVFSSHWHEVMPLIENWVIAHAH